jgi:hypothetical protein
LHCMFCPNQRKSRLNKMIYCVVLFCTLPPLITCCTTVAQLSHGGWLTHQFNLYILYNLAGVLGSLFAEMELGCELCAALVELPPYLVTYLLTPSSRVLLEKLTGSQLVKKFSVICGTRRFITAFTSAHRLSLS